MNLIEDDLEFNFSDALSAIKFDDDEHKLSHCMKAVDFVVELPNAYLFVEVKDPCHPKAYPQATEGFKVKVTNGKLQEEIVKKFRDSFVYRWAENKLGKPIHFLSLITLEEALLKNFQDELHRNLPFAGPTRWSRQIVASCHVLNVEAWNRNFPKWTVRRLSEVADDHVEASPEGEA